MFVDTTARRTEGARHSAEQGLICAFVLQGTETPASIELSAVVPAVAKEDGVVWLHFSASNAGARRWLGQTGCAPAEFLHLIEEHESRVHMKADAASLLGVLNDFAFADQLDPSEVVTLWVYASDHLVVTARNHAAQSADVLRRVAKERLESTSGQALLARLLEVQVDLLRSWLMEAASQLDRAEDRILIGDVSSQRERLGHLRRHALHLRRHFAPTRAVLHRLLQQGADARGGIDVNVWRTAHDEFSFAIDEAVAVYERAKILQEELASRLAEATSRNLYVLTICTIVFLPMTLITGIFGMNVSGVPGVGEPVSSAAFWWVMALIGAAGAATYLLIRIRRFF
jgi:zinc transporter